MERVERPAKKGLSKQQILFLGLLFLLAGMISRGVLQNRVLQLGSTTDQKLLEAMSAPATMVAATAALVMLALETCAVPIFAFLLVEEYANCKSRKTMLLYLLITAVISEVPFNYMTAGTYLDLGSRNPVVAMIIGMAVIYFFYRYGEMSFRDVLVRCLIGFAAALWSMILNIEHGEALLIVMMVMWTLRRNKQMLTLIGGIASAACMLISPFYIVSPMGILPVHLHREEDPEDMKILPYLVYPILLLAAGVLPIFI